MKNNPEALIEALLFTAVEPLKPKEIKKVTELSLSEIEAAIDNLAAEYDNPSRGVELLEINQGYQLRTKPAYQSYINQLHQPEVNKQLTQASLETLTIIAYKQPVTRAEIEDIRGVNVSKALKTLQQRGLIAELGRKDTIGNPIIYGTSDKFLEYFGLSDLNELPEPEDFSNLDEEDILEDEELQ
ncbi:SMC-Scp complex subunit ScpB [Acetohalobium arabaticum]|uniref:Segregation and condensation protein B n=1 Tax=Acetohalobium arabaticum (strain ATCC 49924 / DSM 5501 / Z-7288) TaxID=574087 RepID=D9QRP7_ACEAZ|nr:SMC-Scp complex subunit ScpB [Acetohalobium arabaticum]ADL13188.1 chromosome segregation and condensation protein, ScpB [Acetohalobium arabaticum DSM 5501]